jgi:protein ImuA
MLSASPQFGALRSAMSQIEGLGFAAESTEAGRVTARVPLGAERLDGILGGGLKPGCLHEVVAETARDEAAAAGFATALAGLVAQGRPLVWILDDRAAWETGLPYRPGLAACGLDPDTLILVKTRDVPTTLWATEEALRAGAPVVVTELWRARAYDLAASRRLILAARRRGATALVMHVGLRPDELTSGAETRFAVAAAPSARLPSAGHATPIPGPSGYAVRLVKWRGDATRPFGFDRDQVHHLAWDRSGRHFRTPAGPRPVAQPLLPAA